MHLPTELQYPLVQSLCWEQPWPSAHLEQPAPPPSMQVSSPFSLPSLQVPACRREPSSQLWVPGAQ